MDILNLRMTIAMYIATTVIVTLMDLISDKTSERVYFILSGFALVLLLQNWVLVVRAGGIGRVSVCIAVAYLLHSITSLLINNSQPVIIVIIVSTWTYMLIGVIAIILTLVVKVVGCMR